MIELLRVLFSGIVFSGYYFPFEFVFLPGVNTKMVLAVIGIFLFVKQCLTEKTVSINRTFLYISIWAAVFSLASFVSVTYNNTTDYTYATYIVKMWVWWSGAYATLYLIRQTHGKLSMNLVLCYMACICAAQAILGILIDNIPALQQWVDEVILQDIEFLHQTKRLYGIGACFDTAGIRFSCALLGLGYLIKTEEDIKNKFCYGGLFLIIAVAGNIMSRTTTVGVVLALVYIIFAGFSLQRGISTRNLKIVMAFLTVIVVSGWVMAYIYQYNPTFRGYLQYAFEGFFNWVTIGEWSTSSTERLQRMVVWPDNIKTWLLGDGWFVNPYDPNSFYMYTDVGYLRFIYYCGVIGLSLFASFFVFSTSVLCRKRPENRFLFLLFLVLVFVVWIKISTDIFVVFALFLLLDKNEEVPQESSMSALN